MKTISTTLFMSLFIGLISYGQNKKPFTDYLSVPGPVILNKDSFRLAWSSHPSAVYYKQEYITSKDNIEKFKKMVLIEVLTGNAKAADLATAKIAELKQLKQTNPIVNYEIFQKNGEIIIDFLLSENSADGESIIILERNVYRYKNVTAKNGQQAVMLFAASERSYGKEVDPFLAGLKSTKSILLNAVAAYKVPQIMIQK